LSAIVKEILDHPRVIALRFDGGADEIWSGLSQHGKPVQYAHVHDPLLLWDLWTPIAGPPVAFEPPSAGFTLDWSVVAAMKAHGIGFATLTHVAGISSTGDEGLDRMLPFDEPYFIPLTSAAKITDAQRHGGRIIAIGTTVVRALEHAALPDAGVAAGEGLATQRLGPASRLRVVDAILSGTHEPGTSHYELLRAFMDDATLERAACELEARQYRTHEFGDSVFIEGKVEEAGTTKNTKSTREANSMRLVGVPGT
jgi:S-adenosylmethionine:tRNA ribosyltransferase-isomerase